MQDTLMPLVKKLYIYPLSLLLMSVGLTGCGNEEPSPPENIIEEENYIRLLAEFEVINAYLNITNNTEKALEKTQFVLDAYGITMEQFELSNAYYEKDIKEQIKRLEKALTLLNKIELS